MKQHIFITGTDTDIGKTVVTGLLQRGFKLLKENVITQKWCQCGHTELTDIQIHDKISDISHNDSVNNLRLPYLFKDPVSPHLADTQNELSLDKISTCITKLKKQYDILLTEGAGGLMVPLTKNITIVDILEEKKIPCILTIANKVGCINHSLLSIEAIKKRKIPLLGFIMNNTNKTTPSPALNDNPKIIQELSKVPLLGSIPYNTSIMKNNSNDLDPLVLDL